MSRSRTFLTAESGPPTAPGLEGPRLADAAVEWPAWMAAWGGAVGLAFVNAVLRRGYEGTVGEQRADQLSGIVLLVLLAPWVRRTERRHPLPTGRDALTVGLVWGTATVSFEFGFGRFVNGDSWGELLAAYNVFRGRLWALDVLGIAASPAVARWWRVRRRQDAGHQDR